MAYDHPNLDVRHDSPDDVKSLLKNAEQRRADRMKWHLLGEALAGKTIDVTKNQELFEALNRERMDFEEIMKMHPQEMTEIIEGVKLRRQEMGGKWYNPDSDAWWGEKGVIPKCVYYARPSSYWRNKDFVNKFFNDFPVFRIGDRKL
jgi:hypothetical protein